MSDSLKKVFTEIIFGAMEEAGMTLESSKQIYIKNGKVIIKAMDDEFECNGDCENCGKGTDDE